MNDVVVGIFIFVFGLVLGSFFNVVIYRLPLEITLWKGRSICPKCKTEIKPYDLIPVLSWIILGKKCRNCKEKISVRYLIVELISGLLFLALYIQFGVGLELLLYVVFVSMLIIVSFIDIDHMIIPIGVLIVSAVLSLALILVLIYSPLSGSTLTYSIGDHLLGVAVGFGGYLIIYAVARLIYKKEGFGFGDVLLMGAIGLTLGFKFTIIAALLSFYVALMFVLLLRIFGRRFQLKQEIPFGPYICIAALITVFYGESILNWYLQFAQGL